MYSRDIIDALGGYQTLAIQLSLVRSAVYRWIKFGIPADRCVEIAKFAKRLGRDKPYRVGRKLNPGITLHVLMHSRPTPDPEPLLPLDELAPAVKTRPRSRGQKAIEPVN